MSLSFDLGCDGEHTSSMEHLRIDKTHFRRYVFVVRPRQTSSKRQCTANERFKWISLVMEGRAECDFVFYLNFWTITHVTVLWNCISDDDRFEARIVDSRYGRTREDAMR